MKRIRKIVLCGDCGHESLGHSETLCRACYEAKHHVRLSNPQKLALRNYIENGVGIITDSFGKKHQLTISEFEKAKGFFWNGGKKGLATNGRVGSLLRYIGRTRYYEKKVKVVMSASPKREWSYEYKIVDDKRKHTMTIYKATSPSGKIYIGKTVQSLAKRISGHNRCAERNNKSGKFMTALRKYGIDNFKWEVLETTEDYDTLNALECWYIQYYDSVNTGYNLHPGGDIGAFGLHCSDATKLKLRLANLGKKIVRRQPKEMYYKSHDLRNKPWIVVFDKNKTIIGYGRNDISVASMCGLSHATINNLKFNKCVSKKGITVKIVTKYELQQLNIAV